MARPKRPAAKRAARPAKKEATVSAQIVVDLAIDTPTYYINHVEIAVNRHEVALWFARLPTKPGRDQLAVIQETNELVVEPEFQILVPPTLLPGLISAFQKSKETYEAQFGPIGEVSE